MSAGENDSCAAAVSEFKATVIMAALRRLRGSYDRGHRRLAAALAQGIAWRKLGRRGAPGRGISPRIPLAAK